MTDTSAIIGSVAGLVTQLATAASSIYTASQGGTPQAPQPGAAPAQPGAVPQTAAAQPQQPTIYQDRSRSTLAVILNGRPLGQTAAPTPPNNPAAAPAVPAAAAPSPAPVPAVADPQTA